MKCSNKRVKRRRQNKEEEEALDGQTHIKTYSQLYIESQSLDVQFWCVKFSPAYIFVEFDWKIIVVCRAICRNFAFGIRTKYYEDRNNNELVNFSSNFYRKNAFGPIQITMETKITQVEWVNVNRSP
ncbi:uncharacterized protein isoform X2 [Musca autumnalis]|uniref:uncharacterized protein isoform X2 n=1 Tax=Musca autumnalis TaxID=221902 RepID=UPI003CEA07CA